MRELSTADNSVAMRLLSSTDVDATVVVSYVMATCYSNQEFHVGGAEGWLPHPSQPFNQWARKNRFHVNDRLVFEYKKDEDSVLVVNKQHYDTCDNSNPYLKLFGGKSIFDLGRSGKYFFISGNHTRCEEGEKVVVMVMANRAPPPPLPPSPPIASHPPPSHFPKAPSRNGTAPVLHPLPHNSSSFSLSNTVFDSVVYLVLILGVVFCG
ncbi:early nodulin-like protein 2 [Carex littledalei]|uniref:Early nodulin-like protein 2 n=1 Tax=Carex littledalei TaxID=544730 RepID=A0A833R4U2_9POAL|nr:early nodulin-like protein 2 [Carex littledalei]